MKEKKKFFLTILAAVLLVILWVYFIFIPYHTVLIGRDKMIKLYDTKYNQFAVLTGRIEEQRLQRDRIKTDIVKLEEKILSDSDIDNLLRLMKKELGRYNIKIISLRPDLDLIAIQSEQAAGQGYYYLPVVMNLEAGFISFAKFLDDLAQMPYYLQPMGYQISHSNRPSDHLLIRLSFNLLIKKRATP